MSERSQRAKRWVFTLNNFIPRDVLRLRALGRGSRIKYLIFGRETGQMGTRHLQGFLWINGRKSLRQVKELVSERAHFEVAIGTVEQNRIYCSKEGDFEEFGDPASNQGRRTDLDEIKEELENGATELEIARSHFSQWVVYRRSFERYRALLSPKRDFKSRVVVYIGTTGTGKTRAVVEKEQGRLWIACDNRLDWFDGYTGQEAVLFDDFTGADERKFSLILRLLDRYPMDVPVKGGFVNWAPKRIYITSNLEVNRWFAGIDDRQFAALKRRIDETVRFHNLMIQ